MAHIRERGIGKRKRFLVSYRNEVTGQNATARHRTIEDAMLFFWRVEVSEHHLLPVSVSADKARKELQE